MGKDSVSTVAPIMAIAMFATEKLRSRNSDRGTSGSRRFFACHTMNATMMSAPAMIRRGTLIGTWVSSGPICRESVTVPQS